MEEGRDARQQGQRHSDSQSLSTGVLVRHIPLVKARHMAPPQIKEMGRNMPWEVWAKERECRLMNDKVYSRWEGVECRADSTVFF